MSAQPAICSEFEEPSQEHISQHFAANFPQLFSFGFVCVNTRLLKILKAKSRYSYGKDDAALIKLFLPLCSKGEEMR